MIVLPERDLVKSPLPARANCGLLWHIVTSMPQGGSYMSKKGIAYVLILFIFSVFMSFGAAADKASADHIHGPDGEYIEVTRE